MTAVIPPRIRPGETLGICAPSGPVNPERFAAGVAKLGQTFRLRIAESLTTPRDPTVPSYLPSYLAASDDVRAAELGAMLTDPEVRAIVLARGGYGLMRILPRLDPAALARDPKPIVGFSDATALLAWAHAAGVRSIHGPMITQLGEIRDADAAQLIRMLTEPRALGRRPWQLASRGTGVRRGPLVPANLTLVSMLTGTPWPVPLDGALALLEEVGERPYEIDRYLTQLVLTGDLPRVEAVIVGDLVRCSDPSPPAGGVDPPDAALQAILDRVAAAGVAAAIGAPVGHGARNEPLPFGGAAILDLDAGTLDIVEPAVG